MKINKCISIILIILFSSCSISNIYSDLSKNTNSKSANIIIEKTVDTYGGLQNWKKVKNASATITDNWPTLHWRLFANPWKNQTTQLNFDWQPNSNNARIEILTGKNKGKKYGMQNWETYYIEDSTLVFKKNKELKFHLPTIEYFFEFPFRIQESNKLHYGGNKEINGKWYEAILMSWDTFEPQKKVDQYLIYVNPETHLIDYLEFTVRDQAKFTYATVHFEDFKKIGIFIFPHKITAYFQNKVPGKTIGHQMKIDTFLLDNPHPNNYFIPNSSVTGTK